MALKRFRFLVLTAGDLIRIDTKIVAFELRMLRADTFEQFASCEAVEMFFDPNMRASAAMPDSVRG